MYLLLLTDGAFIYLRFRLPFDGPMSAIAAVVVIAGDGVFCNTMNGVRVCFVWWISADKMLERVRIENNN